MGLLCITIRMVYFFQNYLNLNYFMCTSIFPYNITNINMILYINVI